MPKEQEAVPDASKLSVGAADCGRSNSRGPDMHPARGPCWRPCQGQSPALLPDMERGRRAADTYRFSAWLSDGVDRFD
jgi:hypothetical protein